MNTRTQHSRASTASEQQSTRVQTTSQRFGETPHSPERRVEQGEERAVLHRSRHETVPTAAPPIVHEVRRSSGQLLDRNTLTFMEPRFGHDFSRVRVHDVAEAARAVSVQTHTVGRNLASVARQPKPETPGGIRLPAHELTHVVQQRSTPATDPLTVGPGMDRYEREADAIGEAMVRARDAGDAAFAGAGVAPVPSPGILVSNRRLLQKKSGDGAEVKKAPDATELKSQAIAALTGMAGLAFKQDWAAIAKQITSPVLARPKPTPLQKKYSQLFAEEFVTNMKKLTAEQREAIAADIEGQLASAITGVAAADLKKEYETTLSSFVRGNIEGGYPGYVAARKGLLNTFGSLDKVNEYYKSMASADFPSASSSVRGAKTSVHPNLKRQLQSAASVLKARKVGSKTWLELVEVGIGGIGGFNIRENRNKPSELSDHSFGWAIDIDAALNPNVKPKSFPQTLVQGFTGEDVYGGTAANAFRSGGTADELLPHARTLRSASDEFKAGFESEAALKTAITGYLSGKGLVIDDTQATALFDLLKAGTKKNRFKKKEIEKWLSSAKATTAGTSGATPAAKGSTAAASWSDAPKIADFLIKAYGTFRGTTTSGGKKIDPAVSGTPYTVAAHGFLNLPAELISALTGSDGGNLQWLGSVKKGTKDFMHFQLKSADQPTLPKETASTAKPAKAR